MVDGLDSLARVNRAVDGHRLGSREESPPVSRQFRRRLHSSGVGTRQHYRTLSDPVRELGGGESRLGGGPPGDQAPSPAAWDWAQVAELLEEWIRTGPAVYADERPTLHLAAHVLREWRAREHHNAQTTDSEQAGDAPDPPTRVT